MSASGARTVYSADWVLPIDRPPIAGGAVCVVGDRIAYVGTATDLPDAWRDAAHVALGCAALLPGLVNVHTHLELTALRGFLEGLAFRDWLVTLTRARRECLDAEALLDAAHAGIDEAFRNGITTCADTAASTAPLVAMRNAGMRGIGYLEVFGPDPAQVTTAMAGLMETAVVQRHADTPLVRAGLSPHAPYTVSAALYRAVAEVARREQWPLAVHIAESEAETLFVREGRGPFAEGLRARGIPVAPLAVSPIALLDTCGILACDPLLIHAIQVDTDDIARIASTGGRVAHCPISNLKLGQGIAPIDQFLAANIPTGLGTDSVASNDRMDLLGEARQATLLQAFRRRVPDALSAHDALALATHGGARALGMDGEIGTLAVGKAADLTAFRLDHPDAQPVYDPAVALVHALAGAALAVLTVVAGVQQVRDGVRVQQDPARDARIATLGARLRAWRATVA